MTAGNIDKLKQIFMEVFSISEAEVESYRKLNNSKWDSLASVTLIVAIESEFKIQLQELDYESLSSFSSAELILERYL
ncbi:acyl carrier protein [Alphaproteobacteria bacterium]|nr:acyl carrier protein [Alphaproteobacteria bacterium]